MYYLIHYISSLFNQLYDKHEINIINGSTIVNSVLNVASKIYDLQCVYHTCFSNEELYTCCVGVICHRFRFVYAQCLFIRSNFIFFFQCVCNWFVVKTNMFRLCHQTNNKTTCQILIDGCVNCQFCFNLDIIYISTVITFKLTILTKV